MEWRLISVINILISVSPKWRKVSNCFRQTELCLANGESGDRQRLPSFLSVYLNLYLCHLSLSVVQSSLISRAIIYFLTVYLNLYLCHLSLSVVHSSLISRLSYTFWQCTSISTSVISPYHSISGPILSDLPGYHILSDSVPQSLPLSSLPISGPFLTDLPGYHILSDSVPQSLPLSSLPISGPILTDLPGYHILSDSVPQSLPLSSLPISGPFLTDLQAIIYFLTVYLNLYLCHLSLSQYQWSNPHWSPGLSYTFWQCTSISTSVISPYHSISGPILTDLLGYHILSDSVPQSLPLSSLPISGPFLTDLQAIIYFLTVYLNLYLCHLSLSVVYSSLIFRLSYTFCQCTSISTSVISPYQWSIPHWSPGYHILSDSVPQSLPLSSLPITVSVVQSSLISWAIIYFLTVYLNLYLCHLSLSQYQWSNPHWSPGLSYTFWQCTSISTSVISPYHSISGPILTDLLGYHILSDSVPQSLPLSSLPICGPFLTDLPGYHILSVCIPQSLPLSSLPISGPFLTDLPGYHILSVCIPQSLPLSSLPISGPILSDLPGYHILSVCVPQSLPLSSLPISGPILSDLQAIIYFLTVYLNLYLCHLSLSVVQSSLISRAIIYFLTVYLNLYLCHLSLSVVQSSLISRLSYTFWQCTSISTSVISPYQWSNPLWSPGLSYTFWQCTSISTSVISPYQWSIPHWSPGYHILSDSVPQSLPLSSLPISGPFLTDLPGYHILSDRVPQSLPLSSLPISGPILSDLPGYHILSDSVPQSLPLSSLPVSGPILTDLPGYHILSDSVPQSLPLSSLPISGPFLTDLQAIICFLTVYLNLYLCHLSLSVVHSSLIFRLSYTFCQCTSISTSVISPYQWSIPHWTPGLSYAFWQCTSISTSVISPYQWSIPHWSSGYHILSDSVPQSLPLSSLPISGPILTDLQGIIYFLSVYLNLYLCLPPELFISATVLTFSVHLFFHVPEPFQPSHNHCNRSIVLIICQL